MSVSDKANPYSSRLAMIGSKDRSVAWYDVPITTVDEPVRDLLENYSQIPSDEVIPRIIETVSLPSRSILANLITISSATKSGTSSPGPASANSASWTSLSSAILRTPPSCIVSLTTTTASST